MKKVKGFYGLIGVVMMVGLLNFTSYSQCNFTVSATKACRGNTILFSVSGGSYANAMWSFGDGKYDSNAFVNPYSSHIYDTFGVFTASFTGYDASNNVKCKQTISISIYDHPHAGFALPDSTTQCFRGNAFQFKDQSKPGKKNAPITTYWWAFGDGDTSTQQNPLKNYQSSGTYTILEIIKDANGCLDTITKKTSIKVLPNLNVRFTTQYSISCPKTIVTFQNQTDSTNGKCIVKWWWDYGDGSGDSSMTNWNASFKHLYVKDGAFTPKLFVKSCYGCVDSFIDPGGARNIYYAFDITKTNPKPQCFEGNHMCFSQKPRPNAYYWLWTFDDPNSQQLNFNYTDWAPCHSYTAPGVYDVELKIWEPNCIRDTTMCVFIPIKGPMAAIKMPPPAKADCVEGKVMPMSTFWDATFSCLNPTNAPVSYMTRTSIPDTIWDDDYCNAQVIKIDTTFKPSIPSPPDPGDPGCMDSVITGIAYVLKAPTGKTIDHIELYKYTSHNWTVGSTLPTPPIYFPPSGACLPKTMHDSDLYISNCQGPNLVRFTNNSMKYRGQFEIDNDPTLYTIPPGPDMSMDRCKNPSYPWASDSMQYFWDFGEGDNTCTSTNAKPNLRCQYSTQIAPYHLYVKTGCYTAKLTVTDTVTKCTSTASVPIVMSPPDAGWDRTVFTYLNYALQLQTPPTFRRGVVLNGVPCVGQAYPQVPDFSGTLPKCGRQKWWMVFDSAEQCSTPCINVVPNKSGTGVDTFKFPVCQWIDDQTFAMMGNKWIYSDGGCKTIGLIIKTGDCIDTFWYHDYKYIADLQPLVNLLVPSSYDPTIRQYTKNYDFTKNQNLQLCLPFKPVVTLQDTNQAGITREEVSINKSFGAPWTSPISMYDTCSKIKSEAYILCQKDSFTVDPWYGDTTWTWCVLFPNASYNCGPDLMKGITIDTFFKWGYLNKRKYDILSLKDTLLMTDTGGNIITQPGKYTITSYIYNTYGCANVGQVEFYVGDYTDVSMDHPVVCFKNGNDTVRFFGTARYFAPKILPTDPDTNIINYWRDPLKARNGVPPTTGILEKMEWDLNGDGVYDSPGEAVSWDSGRIDCVYHVYTTPGNYTIRMRTTDSNGCQQVYVCNECVKVIGETADFAFAQPASACPPQEIKFLDKSIGINTYEYVKNTKGQIIDSILMDSAVYWKWNFGDNLPLGASYSYLKNPTHVYQHPGKYTVTLYVRNTNGCFDSIVKKFYVVIEGPMPNFSVLDSVGCMPFVVVVKDSSKNVVSWQFTKGDGSQTSFQKYLLAANWDSVFDITYSKPGTYYLSLIGTDSVYSQALGIWQTCVDTFAQKYKVVVKRKPMTLFSGDKFICSGDVAVFNDESDTAYKTMNWNFGDILDTFITENRIFAKPKDTISVVKHQYILPQGDYNELYQVKLVPGPNACPDSIRYANIRVMNVITHYDIKDSIAPVFHFLNKTKGATTYQWSVHGITDQLLNGENINNTQYVPDFGQDLTNTDSNYLLGVDFKNNKGWFRICLKAWIDSTDFTTGATNPGCPETYCDSVENAFQYQMCFANVFTPGKTDTINQKFIIKVINLDLNPPQTCQSWPGVNNGVEKWDLTIFSRWGEKVFQTTDPNKQWDGTRSDNGTDCAAGTYYWILNYQLRAEPAKTANGTVTLIR